MSVGLLALLDDVAALAKAAAASVDDVAAQAMRAGVKSAGVVIDDAAVTPRYVVGLSPARELPIIVRIARGSLKNKILYLLPGALALSLLAPWLITPLLMLGGAYLTYEGAEKVFEVLFPHQAHTHEAEAGASPEDPAATEERIVTSAVRTDFILSAEIMAIALSSVSAAPLATRAIVLAIVGIGITALVYGAVAIIVKADDMGLALAKTSEDKPLAWIWRGLGRALVVAVPHFLKALATIGTAAMIWVGGGILIHGLAEFSVTGPEHFIHQWAVATAGLVPALHGLLEFLMSALFFGLFGLAIGGLLIPIVGKVLAPAASRLGRLWSRA